MKNYIRKYLYECKILLPLHRKEEKTFLKRLKENINEYSMEKENITYEDIIDRFGKPTEVVNSYIADLDSEDIIKNLNKRRVFKLFMLVITGIVLIASISVSIYKVNQYNKLIEEIKDDQPVYYKDTITEEE